MPSSSQRAVWAAALELAYQRREDGLAGRPLRNAPRKAEKKHKPVAKVRKARTFTGSGSGIGFAKTQASFFGKPKVGA